MAGAAVPPLASISPTTRFALASTMSFTTTFAPSSAKRFAIPSPKPEPAPVTIATLLANLIGNWIPAGVYPGMLEAGAGMTLEQPNNLPVVIKVDRASRRHLREARHGHDVAADHHDELRPGSEPHFANVHDVPGRRAAQQRVGRERALRLLHADRIVPVARFLQLLDHLAHPVILRDVGGAVDLGRDRLHLVPERIRVLVDELEVGRLLTQAHDFLRDVHRALAALRPMAREDHLGPVVR